MALLEVLVALLVITTGMLGMASLNARNLAARAETAEQLRGLRLAADAVGILRMLPPAHRGAAPVAAPCAGANACTAAAFADFTLAQWQRRVQRELPGGSARLSLTANNTVVHVQLNWQRAGSAQQLALESGL
ncbi:MAG: hypothetical protein V2J12_00640 [Gammaproteobacteria bacterium]|jgi:type IV pilus assembly protein PilV|nr:hypothetical protein [Gammaproteobacteria bacterium]